MYKNVDIYQKKKSFLYRYIFRDINFYRLVRSSLAFFFFIFCKYKKYK